MMKKTPLLLLTGLMLMALTLPAFAAPARGKPEPGKPAEQTMTAEQQAKAKAIIEEYEGKMMPMQDKLWGKFLELRALESVAGVTKDDIAKVVDEIVSLRAQIRTEHMNLAKAFEKAGLPPSRGYHGFGGGHMGMMGGHMGMGVGPCGGAGYGGPCPGAMMDGQGPGMMGGHRPGMKGRPDGGPHMGGPREPRPAQ